MTMTDTDVERGMERITAARLRATTCIARVVRCGVCGEMAFEAARERVTGDEIAVRYDCAPCRWHQTRHFFAPGGVGGGEGCGEE